MMMFYYSDHTSVVMNDVKTDIMILCNIVNFSGESLLQTGTVSALQESLNYKVQLLCLTACILCHL